MIDPTDTFDIELADPQGGNTGILGCNGVGRCPAGSYCLRDVPCMDRVPPEPKRTVPTMLRPEFERGQVFERQMIRDEVYALIAECRTHDPLSVDVLEDFLAWLDRRS
jgi:hypothetical protein